MSRSFNVAVLGATGEVGQTILAVLTERGFPIEKLYPLASQRSAGDVIRFANKSREVIDVADFDFDDVHIALFSAGADVSAKFAPIAAEAGCIVIDNTSQFRYDEDIPLVVPEVNPESIADFRNRNIIANPNCSTIQMVVALKPIYDAVGISRINVATYQSVSGSGKGGITELSSQAANLMNGIPVNHDIYPTQIAFNVIPQIDEILENGYTREEMKMFWETRKLFNDQDILVNATAVRVPVFYGHSEAIHIETRDKISVEEVKNLLRGAQGVFLMEDHEYPTPVNEGTNQDSVYVGRIREDISHPNGLNLWVVADNVRKGAATNAVQIAEILINEYL